MGDGAEPAWFNQMNASSVIRTDFPQVKRGYAPDEVTTHLGRVAEHVADLESRIQELETKLLEAQRAPTGEHADPYQAVGGRITELIKSFDQEVARQRSEAEAEAGRILGEARTQAERIEREAQVTRDQAELDAAKIVSDVTEQAERLVTEARREADELLSGYSSRREALLQDLGQIGEWLTETSASLNAVLQRASDDIVVVEPKVEQPTQS
jgi:cell division septum initiation protein DivIVA